ncbi:g8090 [Coccomyxa viridis]|uniref:G8090 protein n=1 Tax=Coccomyxa viridis TaxID=1274662 RepID=A0ABP1G1Z4_9CHLO
MGIINRSKLGAVAEVNTTYVRRGGKDEMEAEVTSNARVTVQETYLLEPQNAAGAIDSFLSRDPDIGQEMSDNLRTAAHELRSVIVLHPKGDKAAKAAK